MDCFHPIYLSDRIVPCGKCVACLKNRQDDWVMRITHELEDSLSAYFITLTYNDNCLPHALVSGIRRPVLCKSDLQKWFKRLRYYYPQYNLRYFACGEYGDKGLRPHYHVILFNFPKNENLYQATVHSWKFGFAMVKDVTPGRIAYVAKYSVPALLSTDSLFHGNFKPFILSSRRPAIGRSWIDRPDIVRYFRQQCIGYSLERGGIKRRLPRYYRDKLYDDEMKAIVKDKCDVYKKSLEDEEKIRVRFKSFSSIDSVTCEILTKEEKEKCLISKYLSKHKNSNL